MENPQTQVMEQNKVQTAEVSREKKLIGYILIIAAITTLIFAVHVKLKQSMNYESFRAPTLSYFTIQSNIIVAMWMLILSTYLITGKRKLSWCTNINLIASLTTYILVTGVIYWGVLTPMLWNDMEAMWLFSASNIWMHTTTPVLTVLLYGYSKKINTFPHRKSNFWIFYIYPVLYMIMALGFSVKGVYLYPILNPNIMGGYFGVAICIIVMLIVFTGLYLLLLGVKRKKLKE